MDIELLQLTKIRDVKLRKKVWFSEKYWSSTYRENQLMTMDIQNISKKKAM